MIENARLTERVVEQEKVRRDLALAAEVQKRLLPDQPPQVEVAELAALSLPARTIGGDYYDFIDVGDRRIAIALADVSGKGVAAALIMSVVQASLRIIASEGEVSLPQLAQRLNRYLYKSTPSNKYATFFYAQSRRDDPTASLCERRPQSAVSCSTPRHGHRVTRRCGRRDPGARNRRSGRRSLSRYELPRGLGRFAIG